MSKWAGTINALAAKLGVSVRRVQQLLNELEIEVVVTRTLIISNNDLERLKERNTKVGRPTASRRNSQRAGRPKKVTKE